MSLLDIRGLSTSFFIRSGELRVLDALDLAIEDGEVVGLVGETGSGKSVTAYSVMRLLRRPGRVVGGEVMLDGRDLLQLPTRTLEEEIRGRQIAMIFQNPREALNPLFSVGSQLTQVLRLRRGLSKAEARDEAIALLRSVHISDPERRLRSYPHELSGGTAQRVMIALALSCRPRLLIADEPTTGLDVTTQYQIVELLREIRAETGMAMLLITHDLALAAEICDRVAVLYAGRLAELGPLENLFGAARHPYTRALLAARPRIGLDDDIPTIRGRVADLTRPPSGCRFHPRCDNALAVCAAQQPPLETMPPGQQVACHNPMPLKTEAVAHGR